MSLRAKKITKNDDDASIKEESMDRESETEIKEVDTDPPTTSGKKSSKQKFFDGPESSVLRLSHIPYGFFEKELNGYFSQFGKVLRVRVLRNKKGHYNGLAFVEFENRKVAEVAAQTMNGYILAESKLKCRVLRINEVPKTILHGPCFLRVPKKPFENRRRHAEARFENRTKQQESKQLKGFISHLKKRAAKVKALGINYDFDFIFKKLATFREGRKDEARQEIACGDDDGDEKHLH